MTVPRARLLDLMKVQCRIFGTTFNPDGIRMGNKILRQRLRGPTLASYYPPRPPSGYDLYLKFSKYGLVVPNPKEEDRREHIEALKARGKGAPKKKSKEEAALSKKKKK